MDCNSKSTIAPDTDSCYMGLGKGGVGLGGGTGKCLLERPVAVIRGQPGIVRHIVLNNRRVPVVCGAFHDLLTIGWNFKALRFRQDIHSMVEFVADPGIHIHRVVHAGRVSRTPLRLS